MNIFDAGSSANGREVGCHESSESDLAQITIINTPLLAVPAEVERGKLTRYSTDQICSPVEREKRAEYLNQLLRGEIAPIILLSGASGAGKSYLLGLLQELGIEQPPRLITRPKRDSDGGSDVSWNPADPEHSLEEIMFSYEKHGGYYGFQSDPITRAAREGQPLALIIGDLGKVSPIAEALSNHLPLAPIIALRLDVPLDVAKRRMETLRKEAFVGEATLRDEVNKRLELWEKSQLADLKQAYNLHVLVSLSQIEHQELGYENSQLKPLTLDLVAELLTRFRHEATETSSTLAEHILTPLRVSEEVNPSLMTCLREKLIPIMSAFDATPVLKGGLAVAAYLGTTNSSNNSHNVQIEAAEPPNTLSRAIRPGHEILRPVSQDIDWTFGDTFSERTRHQLALEALTGSRVRFTDFVEKPLFNSNKITTEIVAEDGTTTELDCIALSRVKPEGYPFRFDFPYTGHLDFFHRDLDLGGGQSVQVVAPELLIAEKLSAGRGSGLGKFDLVDALSLLVTQPINLHLIKYLIESQKFEPDFDREALVANSKPKLSELNSTLRSLGITDPKLLVILSERMLSEQSNGPVLPEEISQSQPFRALPFVWNADTVKKAAFIDSMIRSLHKIQVSVAGNSGEISAETAQALGSDNCLSACTALTDFLYYYAQFQLGRGDVYVKRSVPVEL